MNKNDLTALEGIIQEENAAGQDVPSIALLDALRYVACETQRNPADSVRDICNEAFEKHKIPLLATWSTDPERPIQFIPSNDKEETRGT
jgi:hypothetical protein